MCLSARLSAYLFAFLSVCLSVRVSVCVFVCLSVCLSVCVVTLNSPDCGLGTPKPQNPETFFLFKSTYLNRFDYSSSKIYHSWCFVESVWARDPWQRLLPHIFSWLRCSSDIYEIFFAQDRIWILNLLFLGLIDLLLHFFCDLFPARALTNHEKSDIKNYTCYRKSKPESINTLFFLECLC